MKAHQKLASVLVAIGCVAGAACAHQLGPTGLQGTISGTTIKVMTIAEGSPADGKIKIGAQIIGLGASNFEKDVRREVADAIGGEFST